MIVYYAHCKAIYGTPQETRDIQLLEQLGFTVLNPNHPEHQEGCKEIGMEYFHKLVEQADLLAFRALPGGAIPAGVAIELERAEIPVIELPSLAGRQTLNVEETRAWLKECGER